MVRISEENICEGSPEWFTKMAQTESKIVLQEHMESLREAFMKRFSPDKLARMSGEELLENVFGNGEYTMLYLLTIDNDEYRHFGAPGKYTNLWIVYNDKKNGWSYHRGKKTTRLTYSEAVMKAKEIRDGLLMGINAIDETGTFDSIADYETLDRKLNSFFFSRYAWVMKYYQMVYPKVFPGMYADDTINRAMEILGLERHGRKKILNAGEIALFIKKCGIYNIVFNKIYSERWTWTEKRLPSEFALKNVK